MGFVLHIDGYSRTKQELPTGKSIKSRPFRVGDLSWHVNYYPNGQTSACAEFVSVFLHLEGSVAAPVKATAVFSLLDPAGKPNCSCSCAKTEELRAEDRIARTSLVVVPPSDLNQQLGNLLTTEDGVDVTFQVAGEAFKVHRCLLAARSLVFKAQLLGGTRESITAGDCIRIDDMLPQVFKTLLHFVYTDSLPEAEMEEQEKAMMAQHLLEAADRYDMQRLKLI
ncbi:BTB/POZ and MATH domain-containing protein 1-like [Panicum virgatum]|uniref:BTB/POZ and MATH domain-containing protein 1-like n=1 Tax=Panicum virgatum TaxID=38727 RepID=UPI0019D5B334|nr:BTB/POZ and MATH domain-containing protein 1-like [Panicum virgatum]